MRALPVSVGLRGRRGGVSPSLPDPRPLHHQIRHRVAKPLGVSPGTLYNHIPDLKELRAGAVPSQLETSSR
jgi:hypothetical protein